MMVREALQLFKSARKPVRTSSVICYYLTDMWRNLSRMRHIRLLLLCCYCMRCLSETRRLQWIHVTAHTESTRSCQRHRYRIRTFFLNCYRRRLRSTEAPICIGVHNPSAGLIIFWIFATCCLSTSIAHCLTQLSAPHCILNVPH